MPSVSVPLGSVYAQVRDKDLGEVRRRVTLRTLSHPATALPAAHLPSCITELFVLAVCAQMEVRASKVGIYMPVNDADTEEQLVYGVLEMVLAISRIL